MSQDGTQAAQKLKNRTKKFHFFEYDLTSTRISMLSLSLALKSYKNMKNIFLGEQWCSDMVSVPL